MTDVAVTVVIVTYKVADLTIECLRSLEPERHSAGLGLQVVVVDNASGDEEKVAAAIEANQWHSWVRLVVAPKNGGFAYGCNLGVRLACEAGSPDYIHFLNPDTVIREGAVRQLVEFMEGQANAGLAGGTFEDAAGDEFSVAFRFPSILGEIESGMQLRPISWLLKRWQVSRPMGSSVAPVDWVSGASMMVRRQLLEDLGGLDERYFLYFEETDFAWRAKRAGFGAWFVPASRVMHVGGQSSNVSHDEGVGRRLPRYWFASRRRWFHQCHGLAYAIVADICAAFAGMLGWLKNKVCGRDRGVPFYVRDLLRHSFVRRGDRGVRSFD